MIIDRDFMPRQCSCCYSDNIQLLLIARDRTNTPIKIFHCQRCCALVPDYPLQADDVVRHQADFHAAYWADGTAEVVIEEARQMLHTVDFYRDQLARYESSTPILDLGGGRGLLTKALLDRGYNAMGCDPSEALVACARDVLNIAPERYAHNDMVGFTKAQGDLDGKVGAIFLWHVIEHMEHPMEVLKALHPLLRSDGLIIAQGPLLAPEYIFPEHRFLHSESNISWMARELGMKLLFIDSFSKERFVSFVFGAPGHPDDAVNGIYMPEIPDATGALFNTLSQALAFARNDPQ